MKVITSNETQKLSDIPNIGKQMTAALLLLGVESPTQLQTKDPWLLYTQLGVIKGARQDPCVLDTFMAAIDYCNGAPSRPWWQYTAQRKQQYPDC